MTVVQLYNRDISVTKETDDVGSKRYNVSVLNYAYYPHLSLVENRRMPHTFLYDTLHGLGLKEVVEKIKNDGGRGLYNGSIRDVQTNNSVTSFSVELKETEDARLFRKF